MGDAGTRKALETISPIEFASTLVSSVKDQEQRHTWFFGAGCSLTSGIPTAGGLVEKWLRELQQNQKLPKAKFDAWVQAEFSGFDPQMPARHYAQVFRRRHRTLDAQQREIEQICSRSEPSYGYATFAQVLSLKDFGKRCNTILTTNFDDLVADALYMYGDREMRPQIITHEALARYVRTGSSRPTIIKLHGDAHFTPKNMQNQTDMLEDGIAREVEQVVRDSALIFVGYGGNDESIAKFFANCPTAELAPQVYWVGKHDPGPRMLEWLIRRDALRVDHTDFDKLMHHLRGALDIPHPEKTRWEQNFKRYLEQYKSFEDEIKNEPEGEEKAALQQTSQTASKSLPTDWEYYLRAESAKSADEKESIYLKGLEDHPNSCVLAERYAVFLETIRRDMDGAEAFYKRAIDLDPDDAGSLGNYALFLSDVRKQYDAAEVYYKRAVDVGPKDPINLSNYAIFLSRDRKRSTAEVYFKRAIDAGPPEHANTLGNYALFLQIFRKDMEGAETFYKRAIEADPKHANTLGNYASFLKHARKDVGNAETYYKRAIEADPKYANALGNFAQILFATGRAGEGLKMAHQAMPLADNDALKMELLLYTLVHDPDAAPDTLGRLKALILGGGRSPGWDFSTDLAAAERQGRADLPLLGDVVKVIVDEAPASILDVHAAWRDA